MATALIVLQARFRSQRLPGKALADLAGRPVLARCLDRLRMSCAAPVVLATTTRADDDALVAVALDRGVPVVRGPEDDVLARFVMAVARFGASYAVRATADNPFVDIDAPRRVLEALVAWGADHVVEAGLPYGAGVEAVTAAALRKADLLAREASDREHVTTYIRRSQRFAAVEIDAPAPLRHPDLRLTVDTPEDLEFARAVMAQLAGAAGEPSLSSVIGAAYALMPALSEVVR